MGVRERQNGRGVRGATHRDGAVVHRRVVRVGNRRRRVGASAAAAAVVAATEDERREDAEEDERQNDAHRSHGCCSSLFVAGGSGGAGRWRETREREHVSPPLRVGGRGRPTAAPRPLGARRGGRGRPIAAPRPLFPRRARRGAVPRVSRRSFRLFSTQNSAGAPVERTSALLPLRRRAEPPTDPTFRKKLFRTYICTLSPGVPPRPGGRS